MIGKNFGVEGVAVGVVISFGINYTLMAHLTLCLVGLKWKDLLLIHLKALIFSSVIWLVCIIVATLMRTYYPVDIAIVAAGLIVCAVSWVTLLLVTINIGIGNDVLWLLNKIEHKHGMLLKFIPNKNSSHNQKK